MKKTILITLLAFIIMSLPIQGYCVDDETDGGRYWWMTSNEFSSVLFDSQTIKYSRNFDTINQGVIDVWFKCKYTKLGRDDIINKYKKAKLPTEGYENLDTTLHHYLVNIKSNSLKWLGQVDYNTNGKVLSNFNLTESEATWQPVVPGSLGEAWLNAIKDYSIKNSDALKERS